MAKPTCLTLQPDNLTFTSAKFHGKCVSTGGVSTKMAFGFDGYPPHWYQHTPWWNVPYDGYELSYVQGSLSYATKHNFFSIVYNAYGYGYGGSRIFWLPRPKHPVEGSPFLVLAGAGTFDNGTYTFRCTTDVACSLYALVGLRKPYIHSEIQISEGVAFRHDPYLVFNWKTKIIQEEEGDSIYHTFVIPYAYLDITYWFVLLGSVDGKISPSISPFFKFRRMSFARLVCNPAFAITHEEAYIGGKLLDDKGAGVYLRLRWTKYEEYENYTEIDGPHRSFWQITEKITGLDPDTKYKYSIIGSHDKDMIRHSYSQPCYFTTEKTSAWYSIFRSQPHEQLYHANNPDWISIWESNICAIFDQAQSQVHARIINVNDNYSIRRHCFCFNTATIPDNAIIYEACFVISLNTKHDTGRPWSMIIQYGNNIYPHKPARQDDYLYLHYSGDVLLNTISSNSDIGIHNCYLNAWGLSLINKTKATRFIIRVSTDVIGVPPLTNTDEGMQGFCSQMKVRYHVPS